MSCLPQSYSLPSWVWIPCSLHNGTTDGTEPGPKDWGQKEVGPCLHGMWWEEGGKVRRLQDIGVFGETVRGGESGDGERGRDHLGEAPRQTRRGRLCRKLQESITKPHPLRSELSALSNLESTVTCPPKVEQWSKKKPWQRRGN